MLDRVAAWKTRSHFTWLWYSSILVCRFNLLILKSCLSCHADICFPFYYITDRLYNSIMILRIKCLETGRNLGHLGSCLHREDSARRSTRWQDSLRGGEGFGGFGCICGWDVEILPDMELPCWKFTCVTCRRSMTCLLTSLTDS
jgi:hypothetical protein